MTQRYIQLPAANHLPTPLPALVVCGSCGSVVWSIPDHDYFHERLGDI